MADELEGLLVEIINLFADTFGKSAVLRGGMVLRLLDSARLTNDLDYTFVPYKSKNQVVNQVVVALRSLKDVKVRYSLNSKCLRCVVTRQELVAQVKIKVELDCRVSIISTSSLSKLHNQTARIINVIAYDIALANKLAAWYERRLFRDIYDIYLFLNMGVTPNEELLQKRLKKPVFAKNVKDYLNARDISSFYEVLKDNVDSMNKAALIAELKSILSEEELLGLDLKIKNCILRKLK